MKLIVGLGNPGKQYSKTRHNAGFFVIENFVSQNNLGTWEFDNKYKAEIIKSEFNNTPIILIKPQTFMNKSGESVGTIANFYKIPASDILVIHDEIDIPTAKIQAKFGGSSAGHNGLKSIIASLGTKDFWRIRIGVDRPVDQDQAGPDFSGVVDYVLSNFKKEEIQSIENKFPDIEKLISDFIKE